MGKHRWFALALAVVLALPALAACATPTGGRGDSPSLEPSAGAGSPGPSGSTNDPTQAPSEEDHGDMDPAPGAVTTLRGTASEGVEANCLVLAADDGKSYLLLGGDRNLINSGARIEVQALIQPDLMTTCQQGIPAVVQSVRKI
jgi:hypothetical protein